MEQYLIETKTLDKLLDYPFTSMPTNKVLFLHYCYDHNAPELPSQFKVTISFDNHSNDTSNIKCYSLDNDKEPIMIMGFSDSAFELMLALFRAIGKPI